MSSSPPSLSKLVAAASSSHLLLLLLAGLSLLALTVFVVHPNDLRLQSFLSGGCPHAASVPLPAAAALPPAAAAAAAPGLRLLIGILTLPGKYERRHLLRTVYALQQQQEPALAGDAVDVRFVFCNLTSPEDAIFVALEIMRYGDVIVLDCTENMDNGKTYIFFSAVAAAGRRYDYVMKTDDDTYLRLPALVESLRGKAREDAYYGLVMPCDRENFYPFPPFMSGMGYALSWDLVEWVATSEVSAGDRSGPEDMWTGRWLNMAGKARNRYDEAPRMYNYKGPSPASCFRHDFVPDTVAVHMLKDAGRWAETLRYFNATAALPPSKLYHFP